jgi:hypothetical protein
MTAPASDGGVGHDTWSELTAGWALYALDPVDEQAFRSHLHTCARCQQDVAAHLAVAGHLASSLSDASGLAPEMPLLLRKEAGLIGGPRGRVVRARRDVMRSRWLTTAAAAAVALVVGAGVGLSLGGGGHPSSSSASSTALVQALDKGQRTVLTSVDGTSDATAVTYAGKGYIVTSGLPSLSGKGEQYVAWIAGSSGDFHAVAHFEGASKTVNVDLGPTSSDVHSFAISREKAGPLPAHASTLVLGSA